MTVNNFDQYPQNVGILAMEMYFPSRVSDGSDDGSAAAAADDDDLKDLSLMASALPNLKWKPLMVLALENTPLV